MWQFTLKTFGRGLLFVLPIILCLYILILFFRGVDNFTRGFILFLFPSLPYIPGMGVVLGCLLIFGVGILMSNHRLKNIISTVEMPFKNMPLVKSLYSAIKDLTNYFTPSEKRKVNRVVVVSWPEINQEMIGFLTREDLSDMPEGITKDGRVAVYFPMSYQVGGYTAFVSKERVKEIDIPIEDAMRSVITAWLPARKEDPSDNL